MYYYPFLRLTNLTDTPYQDTHRKVDNAIEEYEKQEEIELTEEQKQNVHDSIDGIIEQFEEEGKVSDILSFVDNMIVNFDYLEHVKELVTFA